MQRHHQILLPFLILLSWVYGCIIWLRNQFYDIQWIKLVVFNKPIISVGNITTGGTGKTPLVIYLAQLLQKNGKKPGIISRGYGRKSQGLQVVHDGKKLTTTEVAVVGDEPYLIARTLENVPVIVSENRIKGIKHLLDYYPDVIIMDDGFQHRKVKRDLDILTVSANDRKKYYELLPWGNLREPLKNIERADLVIYTKTDNYKLPNIHFNIQPFIKSKYLTSTFIYTLMKYDDSGYQKTSPPDKDIFAFCGIADPQSFIRSAEELSLEVKGSRFFNDHQDYTDLVILDLSEQIRSNATSCVITTEKDLVKLPNSFLSEFEIYVIKINIKFENTSDLISKIQSTINN